MQSTNLTPTIVSETEVETLTNVVGKDKAIRTGTATHAVLSIHELFRYLVSFLALDVLLKISFVCKEWRTLPYELMSKEVWEALHRYINDVNAFRAIMHSTRSIISGSLPLSLALRNRGAWMPNDMDIYISRTNQHDMITHLVDVEGYVQLTAVLGPGEYDEEEDDENNRWRDGLLFQVLKFERRLDDTNVTRIDLIVIIGEDIISPIARFHSTAVMLYITANSLVLLYPRTSLDMKSLHLRVDPWTWNLPWRTKYVSRGYDVFGCIEEIPDLLSGPCREICPKIKRHVGDKYTLVFRYDRSDESGDPDAEQTMAITYASGCNFPPVKITTCCWNCACPNNDLSGLLKLVSDKDSLVLRILGDPALALVSKIERFWHIACEWRSSSVQIARMIEDQETLLIRIGVLQLLQRSYRDLATTEELAKNATVNLHAQMLNKSMQLFESLSNKVSVTGELIILERDVLMLSPSPVQATRFRGIRSSLRATTQNLVQDMRCPATSFNDAVLQRVSEGLCSLMVIIESALSQHGHWVEQLMKVNATLLDVYNEVLLPDHNHSNRRFGTRLYKAQVEMTGLSAAMAFFPCKAQRIIRYEE